MRELSPELAPPVDNDRRFASLHWGTMEIIRDIERIVRQIDELCKAVLNHPSQMANRERLFSELATHTASLSDHASLLQIVPLLGLISQIVARADVVERRIAHSWARAPDDPNAASAIDCATRDLLRDLWALRDMLVHVQVSQELMGFAVARRVAFDCGDSKGRL